MGTPVISITKSMRFSKRLHLLFACVRVRARSGLSRGHSTSAGCHTLRQKPSSPTFRQKTFPMAFSSPAVAFRFRPVGEFLKLRGGQRFDISSSSPGNSLPRAFKQGQLPTLVSVSDLFFRGCGCGRCGESAITIISSPPPARRFPPLRPCGGRCFNVFCAPFYFTHFNRALWFPDRQL